jgi:hypothetical protein
METTVTTTENPAARRQRDPWNKGRLERRCRCLKIKLRALIPAILIHCQVLEVAPNERFVYAWKGGHEGNVG